MIKVLLADKQPLTANGLLKMLVDHTSFTPVVYDGDDGNIAYIIRQEQPQLMVIDPFLEKSGVDHLKQLKADFKQLNILVICNQLAPAEFANLFDLGIKCVVSKMSSIPEIIAGITAATNRETYRCSHVDRQLNPNGRISGRLAEIPNFSAREKEIIHLIAAGLSDKAIAEKLFLSFHTIRTHRKNISKKLGFSLKNAAELIWLTSYLNNLI